MKNQVNRILFALLREEICGIAPEAEVPAEINAEMLRELYVYAKHHDLAHLVADALAKHQLLPPEDEMTSKFEKQHMMAIFRYQRLNYQLEAVSAALEEAKIPFLPLKGSVIRTLYPEPWMRTSCDIDVLVHEEDLERAIKLLTDKLEYKNEGRGSHDVSLRSAEGVHVELHYSLLEDDRANNAKAFLENVWSYAYPAEGKHCQMLLRDEFFYFYHVAHMAKHIEIGGCGIRPFLDLWLLDRQVEHDEEKRNALLEGAKLLTFAEASRALAKRWMTEQELDCEDVTKELERYILGGGVYGTTENRVAVQQKKRGGKVGYILSRIFLPYNQLSLQYPILKKHKWLTPFYSIRRWVTLLFGGKIKKGLREMRINRKTSQDDTERAEQMIRSLGL
ncbi:MAG: nucleotidyltransferase family protein [Clostridia bacterium]|nr:nucleotidyltransferase family protein [Clostridia bacterium]